MGERGAISLPDLAALSREVESLTMLQLYMGLS